MKEQEIANHVNRACEEFLDGHVILGFFAGSNVPVILASGKDHKTVMALNLMLQQLVMAGGVAHPVRPTL